MQVGLLIVLVLGAIYRRGSTPTEAAAVGVRGRAGAIGRAGLAEPAHLHATA